MAAAAEEPAGALFSGRSVVYRWLGERWQDAVPGEALLRRTAASSRVHFVFRATGESDALVSHAVIDDAECCNPRLNAGKQNCWAWSFPRADAGAGPSERQASRLALKFSSDIVAESFKAAFEHAKDLNAKADGTLQEEELHSQRCRLYAWGGKWEDMGAGRAVLACRAGGGRPRFFFRRSKAGPVAEHHLLEHPSLCRLRPNAGSDLCWAWNAQVCSEAGVHTQRVALKFGKRDLARVFQREFDRAKELSSKADRFCREESLYSQQCRLFRFLGAEWKDQGSGCAKLMRQAATKKVRFAFTTGQGAEWRVAVTHYPVRHELLYNLKPNAGKENCWAWQAVDVSARPPRRSYLALRLPTAEVAAAFRDAFDEAKSRQPVAAPRVVPTMGARAREALARRSQAPPRAPAAQHSARPRRPAEAVAVATRAAAVTVTRSDDVAFRRRFVLRAGPGGGCLRIGRDPDCEVCVPRGGVSALHAEVRLLGQPLQLSVLDVSKNGTGLLHASGREQALQKGALAPVRRIAELVIPKQVQRGAGGTEAQVTVRIELDDAAATPGGGGGGRSPAAVSAASRSRGAPPAPALAAGARQSGGGPAAPPEGPEGRAHADAARVEEGAAEAADRVSVARDILARARAAASSLPDPQSVVARAAPETAQPGRRARSRSLRRAARGGQRLVAYKSSGPPPAQLLAGLPPQSAYAAYRAQQGQAPEAMGPPGARPKRRAAPPAFPPPRSERQASPPWSPPPLPPPPPPPPPPRRRQQ